MRLHLQTLNLNIMAFKRKFRGRPRRNSFKRSRRSFKSRGRSGRSRGRSMRSYTVARGGIRL